MIGINALTGALVWDKFKLGGGYVYSIGISPNKVKLAISSVNAASDFFIRIIHPDTGAIINNGWKLSVGW
jgi:hypothetical protein